MYINVVYSKKFPFHYIKRKSKRFFSGSEYSHRNCVFTHAESDCVFALDKNTIHIRIPNDDAILQGVANHFLRTLFGDTMIGIGGLSDNSSEIVSALNYVPI